MKGNCDSLTGSYLICSLITKNHLSITHQREESFVGCNITHVTPRDASVGSRNTRDAHASSDDERLIIDPNILDVVADLPPKNQWTEHLVEYPVIAFIDAANVNRFLNSTVM